MSSQSREQQKEVTLLMDQTWIKIQQRTFTRWCNTFLVERMMKIEDFCGDFTDGVQFCNLLEVISAKKLPKWNKKPRIKAQKLENVSFGLQFLKKEGIKLVAIGPEDVVEPKLKLILGLIWTIILRYQIQRGEDDGGSARSELLKWVRSKIPEYDIKNFAKDWRSGKAITALAQAVEPDNGFNLPADFTNDPVKDATMGMQSAEDVMEIPMILYPEDMCTDADELSTMTYISYFRDYEEKRGQRNADDLIRRTPVADQCRAYGPGLESGECLIPADFIVEARNARGEIIPMGGFPFTATCKDPSGKDVEVKLVDNADGTLNATYLPVAEGNHLVHVQLNGEDIGGASGKKSPFKVPIAAAEADLLKTTITGPGIEGGHVGAEGNFTVKAFNRFGTAIPHGGTPFHLTVTGPAEGADPKYAKLSDNNDGTYSGSYLPILHGTHVVLVELHSSPVAQCPIKVDIKRDPNAADPSQSWAEQLNDATTIEPVKFLLHAVKPDGQPMKTGGDNFDVEVIGPDGDLVPATVKDNGDGTYDVEVDAEEPGAHKMDLFLRNKEIPTHIEHVKDFPKTLNVEAGVDAKETLVQGPGVESTGVLEDHETHFDIIARDKHGKEIGEKGQGLDFVVAVKGPEGAVPHKIEDKKDGSYHVTYTPTAHGDHKVEVTWEKQQVANSPYEVFVAPDINAKKTIAHGPGLENGKNKDGHETSFKIETRDKNGKPAGKHGADQPFKVEVKGPTGVVPHTMKDNGDGTYDVNYTPKDHGDHDIDITLLDEKVADAVYHIRVLPTTNAEGTVVSGPGIEDGLVETYPTHFDIETRDKDGKPIGAPGAGQPFKAQVTGPNGPVNSDLKDNGDGTYHCEYTPEDAGNYTVEVTLDGDHVAKSPYKIEVDARLNSKETKCYGPGLEKEAVKELEPTHFTIETRDKNGKPLGAKVGSGRDFKVKIDGPTGDVPCKVTDNNDGTYTAEYTPAHSGPTTINVTIEEDGKDAHVDESPYKIDVQQKVSAKNTLCHGPGLEKSGVVDTEPTHFMIETRDQDGNPIADNKGAGVPFKVQVKGPNGDVPVNVTDNGDGTYRVDYEPDEAGDHTIDVLLDDDHVADSQYQIKVDAGPYAENSGIEQFSFVVRTKDRKNNVLNIGGFLKFITCNVDGPEECEKPEVEDVGDGRYIVTYKLPAPGDYKVNFKINGRHIKGSPFNAGY